MQSPIKTCTSISAFWHNDLPGGIAVRFVDHENGLDWLIRNLEQSIATYAAEQPTLTVSEIEQQLAVMGKKRDLTFQEKVLTLLNINFLQESDHLNPDEFNGMLYIYE